MDDDHPVAASPVGEANLAAVRGDLSTFARSFSIRGPRLAWFLGAGASAMSDIPTAGALIDRFKHALYCSANNLDVQDIDQNDRRIRARINQYFDGRNGLPPAGDPDEYAVAFETMYPSADVRADFIAGLVRAKRPNFGHYVLAAFMASDLLRIIFTTNFDDLPEQAAHALLDSDFITPRRPIVVAALENAALAKRAFEKDTWPLVAKMHGDFREQRLKNIRTELQEQDQQLRVALLDACQRQGLVVAGYSGRDHSVMEVLRDALRHDSPYPSGLVWCYRASDPPTGDLLDFLVEAQSRGVAVEAIAVDNFIELTGSLEKAVTLPAPVRKWLSARRPNAVPTPTPLPHGATRPYPILRLNALPLTRMPPQAARLHERKPCDLRDAQAAIRTMRARALIARLADGQLIGVGHTTELQQALAPLHAEVTDGRVDLPWSAEPVDNGALGLALDALTLGLGRTNGLRHVLARRGHQVRVLDPNEGSLERLRHACGTLHGTVPKTTLHWAEAVGLTIERRAGEWWLLLVPEIWVPPMPSGQPPNILDVGAWRSEQQRRAAEFIRERRAQRHNRETNAILDAWVRLLCAGRGPRDVLTWNLQPADGVDPSFELLGQTAYSRPLSSWAESRSWETPA